MSDTVNQPSVRPTEKWVATTTTGAAVTVLLWVADTAHVDLPLPVAGAMVLLGGMVAGYFKRNRRPAGSTPGTNGIADHRAV